MSSPVFMNTTFKNNLSFLKSLPKSDIEDFTDRAITASYSLIESHDWTFWVDMNRERFKSGLNEYEQLIKYAEDFDLFHSIFTDFNLYYQEYIQTNFEFNIRRPSIVDYL